MSSMRTRLGALAQVVGRQLHRRVDARGLDLDGEEARHQHEEDARAPADLNAAARRTAGSAPSRSPDDRTGQQPPPAGARLVEQDVGAAGRSRVTASPASTVEPLLRRRPRDQHRADDQQDHRHARQQDAATDRRGCNSASSNTTRPATSATAARRKRLSPCPRAPGEITQRQARRPRAARPRHAGRPAGSPVFSAQAAGRAPPAATAATTQHQNAAVDDSRGRG